MPARPVFRFVCCRNLSGTMRGTVRKITLPRRLVADLMHASTRVPFVSLTRPLNVRVLQEARAQAAQRPGWAAIFVKAFALVAKEQPVLRTLYVKWPLPAFYELPRSVAMVAIARIEDGQDCVLPQKVAAPDEMPLAEVDALIRHAKAAPIDEVPAFRKILRTTRLPLALRRLFWAIGLNFGRQRAGFGPRCVSRPVVFPELSRRTCRPRPCRCTGGRVSSTLKLLSRGRDDKAQ